MEFGKAMIDAVGMLRPALQEAFLGGLLKKATFAKVAGISRGKVEKFAGGGDLSVDDFSCVYQAARQELAENVGLEIPPAMSAFFEFDADVAANENDIKHTRFGQLLRSQADTGDKNDLMRLTGIYLVLRRNGVEEAPITASAIEVSYDPNNNICTWRNSRKTGDSVVETLHGLVTQSRGVFYFFGFMDDSTVLHAMSVYKVSQKSGKFLGVVLTTNLRNPVVSRVVMIKQGLSFDEAASRSGVFTEQGAIKLGLSDLALLDNSCDADGVITALEDLPQRVHEDIDPEPLPNHLLANTAGEQA